MAPLAAALAVAACSGGAQSVPTAGASQTQAKITAMTRHIPQWKVANQAHEACPQVYAQPTCLALTVRSNGPSPLVAGLAPADLEAAYNLPITQGSGQIVAIVDAYDNPNVASDLATYRQQFGLGSVTFNKYNQNGQQSNYPQGSSGWGTEIDLDVDMVSAACPKCTIYLIEANGADTTDLEAAEDEAVKLGAKIVSNSWICYSDDYCGDNNFYNHFSSKGVVYLAASGDIGYDANGAPEAGSSVVSIGGTQLTKQGSGYNETVWSGAGGGCSNNGSGTGITKPTWQHDPSCTYRTDSDVSSEAGCAPGVAEYDTYGNSGWIVECGTSAASPLNAAVFALAGNASSVNAGQHFWQLHRRARKHDVHDITTGNDGSCGGSYLCTAGTKQF
ncbi:MAG: hypothetical protein JO311_01375, partial [Candidatus Eremiobacteraeota bacterium]|nr:hypothetical protein [Candidatus Eremiobacteraeota bacterium]